MSADTQARDGQAERDHPLLFISHRHEDREIAEVLRDFVNNWSGGRVDVFQSSSPEARAPTIGRNVNQELAQALWAAQVLVLVYTKKDGDWDYCMWECGVATHPKSADTRTIVLQCGSQLPRVFAGQIAVDARQRDRIQRFANEFLTDSTFFPGMSEPVSRFKPNDPTVERAAQGLYDELQKVLPAEDEQVEEWPAVPFVRLGLTSSQVRQITSEEDEERARSLTSKLLLEATVLKSDGEVAKLFNRPTLPVNESFGKLLPAAVRQGQIPEWLRSLAAQVTRAAQWNYPSVTWGLMSSADTNDRTWYGPVLTHVRRFPSKAMEFEIHFQRFASRAGENAITLDLPEGEPSMSDVSTG
jgi:hypothetical protein